MSVGARDLVSAVLEALAADGDVIAATGDSDAAPRIFEARDRRRLPDAAYPYGVLVHVAGRYRDLNGRGEALRDAYFDLHWFDCSGSRARELVRVSVRCLRAAAKEGRLDSEEGPCRVVIPGTTRAHVDPRSAEGVAGEPDVIDAFVQLRFVPAEHVG